MITTKISMTEHHHVINSQFNFVNSSLAQFVQLFSWPSKRPKHLPKFDFHLALHLIIKMLQKQNTAHYNACHKLKMVLLGAEYTQSSILQSPYMYISQDTFFPAMLMSPQSPCMHLFLAWRSSYCCKQLSERNNHICSFPLARNMFTQVHVQEFFVP